MSSSNQRPANRGFRSVLRCAISHYPQVPSLSAPEPSGVCTALAVTERSAHDSGSAAPWATRAGSAAHSRIKGTRNRERLCFIIYPFSHIPKKQDLKGKR